MEGHSAHSTAPGRSRSSHSPSPSHSASASVCSSAHKRKLASDDHHPPSAAFQPFSFSDNRDGALTSNDDLDSISARGADDSDSESDPSEDVVGDEEDDEEDNDSMRAFTAARLENNANSRNVKPPKSENSSVVKNESSGLSEIRKEDRAPSQSAGSGQAGAAAVGSISGIVVKEDTVKGIFTENIQTSGAYCAREENLKREEDAGRLKFVCYANDGVDEHMIWLIGLKNIFARQLPNMPKEYIVRLVMDR
ncbi:hypothetical protein ACLOJK_026940 [Asimina triloba]